MKLGASVHISVCVNHFKRDSWVGDFQKKLKSVLSFQNFIVAIKKSKNKQIFGILFFLIILALKLRQHMYRSTGITLASKWAVKSSERQQTGEKGKKKAVKSTKWMWTSVLSSIQNRVRVHFPIAFILFLFSVSYFLFFLFSFSCSFSSFLTSVGRYWQTVLLQCLSPISHCHGNRFTVF